MTSKRYNAMECLEMKKRCDVFEKVSEREDRVFCFP